MDQEVWKDVVGYEGFYEVSNMGRVRSYRGHGSRYRQDATTKHPRLLTPCCDGGGYWQVSLRRDSRGKTIKVHWLVLDAFAGPRPSLGFHGAHLNGNKADNRASNLQWVTPKENNLHRRGHGTAPIGIKNPNVRLSESQVREIRRMTKNHTIEQVAQCFGVTKSCISQIKYNHTWKWLT